MKHKVLTPRVIILVPYRWGEELTMSVGGQVCKHSCKAGTVNMNILLNKSQHFAFEFG